MTHAIYRFPHMDDLAKINDLVRVDVPLQPAIGAAVALQLSAGCMLYKPRFGPAHIYYSVYLTSVPL